MADNTGAVSLKKAIDPLVLAFDIGSTGSRGGIYDAAGRPVEELRGKIEHQFTTKADGTSTIDADQVVEEILTLIGSVVPRQLEGRIQGVGIDTFASTLIGVDRHGRAITPCITYADTRSNPQARLLRARFDVDEVHQATGAMLHSSYTAPRLLWYKEHDPDTFHRVGHWMSLGEYIHLRLLGAYAAGTSTAAWSGMLDRRTGDWYRPLVDATGIMPKQLSYILDPDQVLAQTPKALAADFPALRGASWYAPVGDGLASSFGAGAIGPARLGVSTSTSGAMRVDLDHIPETIPSGLWCYRFDKDRSLLGGAISDCGRVFTFLESTLQGMDSDRGARILAEDPTTATPLFLPFLSGERSTGWNGAARGTFTGISAATTAHDIYRGALEGVVLSYRRLAIQLRELAPDADQLVVSGRVGQERPELVDLLSDAMGLPAEHVTMKRSTMRGTALLMLESLAPDVAKAGPVIGRTAEPREAHRDYWAARQVEFEDVYDGLYA
jgi:gluconokinase